MRNEKRRNDPMLIEEFIEKLSEFNPKAEITTPYSETIELSWISEDGADKKDTKIVFIEGRDFIVEN